MPETPESVDEALDALSEPSTDEVFHATTGFSARAIAAEAAQRALSGGGGGAGGPTVYLTRNDAIDIHDVDTHSWAWQSAFDNAYDQNPVVALPAGIGFTLAINGTGDGTLTTTEAGVWAWQFMLNAFGQDASIVFHMFNNADIGSPQIVGPGISSGQTGPITAAGVIALPSGAQMAMRISTATAAAGDPYEVALAANFTRLA